MSLEITPPNQSQEDDVEKSSNVAVIKLTDKETIIAESILLTESEYPEGWLLFNEVRI